MRAALIAGAAALLLAACGGGVEEPAGLDTSSSTPSTESTGPAADPDTAALKDLYLKYWDAYSQASSGPTLEPRLFKGIATSGFTEQQLSDIDRELVANDVRLVGKAKLSQITVTLDGKSAQVEACLDTSEWELIQDGKSIQDDFGDPAPSVLSAKRSGEGWLLDGNVPTREATITC